MRDNIFDMKRFVYIILLAAFLSVWIAGAGAYVSENWRSDSVMGVRDFQQIDAELGSQKTLVPSVENKWVICRNDPINNFDPDGRDVENNTDYTIWVKSSESADVFPVYAGEKYVGEQDGICDPKNHPGTVFKTSGGIFSDGVQVEVSGDGDISWFSIDPSAVAGQVKNGGEKDNTWNESLNKAGDDGWDPLFDKANDPTSADVKNPKTDAADAIDIGNQPIENAHEDQTDAAK